MLPHPFPGLDVAVDHATRLGAELDETVVRLPGQRRDLAVRHVLVDDAGELMQPGDADDVAIRGDGDEVLAFLLGELHLDARSPVAA